MIYLFFCVSECVYACAPRVCLELESEIYYVGSRTQTLIFCKNRCANLWATSSAPEKSIIIKYMFSISKTKYTHCDHWHFSLKWTVFLSRGFVSRVRNRKSKRRLQNLLFESILEGWRENLTVKSNCSCREPRLSYLAPRWPLTVICHTSSGQSATLLWPPQPLREQDTLTCT